MEEAIRILVVDDEPDIRYLPDPAGDRRLYRVGGRDRRGGSRAGSAAPGA